ncbi:hypothetical protein JAAARDRAFT_363888 [Jaapia argillacea MUCL 33604]|uniref:Tubulin-specific chaperone A n=1 Tax=Jaapia argillacea MUCL 33604 TaxID=933084 RepID=A0A067QHP7_9AGAM|nr:hypothetical protein JAAARDRAFT_363888 [Jaapia argillacea MUCL 33604]
MSDAAAIRRQLKIKSGSVKRLLKEHNMYRKEAEELKLKVEKLVATGGDEWDIKNGDKMMEESNKMVKDTEQRLGVVAQELRDLVVRLKRDPKFADDEELIKAEDALEEANT